MIHELSGVVFEWDDDKAKLVLKEQVTFIEACTIFFDDLSITKEDTRDYGEMRQVTI